MSETWESTAPSHSRDPGIWSIAQVETPQPNRSFRPLLHISTVILAQAPPLISLSQTLAAASSLVSLLLLLAPYPAHSPHHSLSFQLKLKIKSCHCTAYKYIDVFQPAWSVPTSPHASRSQPSQPQLSWPSHRSQDTAGSSPHRVFAHALALSWTRKSLTWCLLIVQVSRIISFKTSSWAKSFVVIKYIQPKIDHFSHFQEHASVMCSTCPLYNHHRHPPWELSHPPQPKLCPLKQ